MAVTHKYKSNSARVNLIWFKCVLVIVILHNLRSLKPILEMDSTSQIKEESNQHEAASSDMLDAASTTSYESISSSSIVSQLASEIAKKAELKIKMSALEEKQRLQIEELELQMKKAKLELDEQMAISEARKQALESRIERSSSRSSSRSMESGKRYRSEVKHDGRKTEELLAISSLLNQQKRSLLPQSTLPCFEGNPLEYRSFIRAFECRIAERTDDFSERLNFLDQFTRGKPNTIVRSYMNIDPEKGYKEARRALERKYGNEHKISVAYLEKLLQWPCMKPGDVTSLDDFAILLRSCINATEEISALSEVNHPKNLQLIVSKLPYSLQERWRRKVHYLSEEGRSCNFSELVDFVEREVDVMSDPIFGTTEMTSLTRAKRSSQEDAKPRNRTSFSTRRDEEASEEKTFHIESKPVCQYCKLEHDIGSCESLNQKSSDERLKIIRDNGLCFGCLRTGHVSKQCRQRKTCKKCSHKHPTILHSEDAHYRTDHVNHRVATNEAPQQRVHSDLDHMCCSSNTVQGGPVMSVIPVVLSGPNQRSVETYAFLDNGSSTTFIEASIANELELTGNETTLTLTTVEREKSSMRSKVLTGLRVSSINGGPQVCLPPVYTIKKIPLSRSDVPDKEAMRHWHYLQTIDIPRLEVDRIGILIGCDCPQALEPWEVIRSENGGPYAVKTILGWTVVGPRSPSEHQMSSNVKKVNRTDVRQDQIEDMLIAMYNSDFIEKNEENPTLSQEDKQWQAKVNDSITLVNGRYQIHLPFREDDDVISFPNNRRAAERRAEALKRKFKSNVDIHTRYRLYMEQLIVDGHAERAPKLNFNGDVRTNVWYLPHHGVNHPSKPDKTRVVFDCSARYAGVSLNDKLLQGPDLTNSLVGVLLRFRQEKIAFMADVKAMYHQVRVPEEHADYLRYLWWPNGDIDEPLEDYRMRVHLFGAVSSPSCANFALRRAATDFSPKFGGAATKNTIERNFYVDDWLMSVASLQEASQLIRNVDEVCKSAGFHLTKFVSNDAEVLETIPKEDRITDTTLNLTSESKSEERALGIRWRIETDTLGFKMINMEKPSTRRGILSTVSSIYDPLGFVAPVLMKPKILLQQLCRQHVAWDEPLSEEAQRSWTSWLASMDRLATLDVNRCYKPKDFTDITSCQVHHFSDASNVGYGAVTYLRMTNREGKIHCSFVIGKARVAPVKTVTVPRLELAAATVAVRLGAVVKRELEIPVDSVTFWTDSTTVLRYINNRTSRFKTYVANRVETILELSRPEQWRYVGTKCNPADEASRGVSSEKFPDSRWTRGPTFLWETEDRWPEQSDEIQNIEASDPELKKIVKLNATTTEVQPLDRLILRYSSWYKLRRAVAYLIRLKVFLMTRLFANQPTQRQGPLILEEMKNAEKDIIKYTQRQAFPDEVVALSCVSPRSTVNRASSLYRLNPVMNSGIIVVGGRLQHSSLPFEARHPAILPSKSHVTDILIQHIHQTEGHQGRQHVLACLRERYWVIKANSAVRRTLSNCVQCRRLQGRPLKQEMADLPADRVTSDFPPFSFVGVDCFGPLLVKRGRGTAKRYGVLFTCLTIRAVHIEVAHSLTSDSFIHALRRFISRRGNVKEMRSDNGTNFVGAERELRAELSRWNQSQVHNFLLQRDIKWTFNTPGASHHGGVWERQIRSAKKILYALTSSQILDDEGLVTLLCEVENIINSRPLTSVSSDPQDLNPITPNQILLLRSTPVLPPGRFEDTDNYYRRKWRQVQHMASEFWQRWRKEYLQTLQPRQKWNKREHNLQVGDIVLLAETDTPRNLWKMALVTNVFPDEKGLVRSVEIKTNQTTIRRPVTKLVLLSPKQESKEDV